jgi:hypothetical protein
VEIKIKRFTLTLSKLNFIPIQFIFFLICDIGISSETNLSPNSSTKISDGLYLHYEPEVEM